MLLAGMLVGMALAGRALADQVVPQRVIVRGCWLTSASEVLESADYVAGMPIAELRRGAAAASGSGNRWLRAVVVDQLRLRTAIITVDERCPLLRVETRGARYWLCDDGTLVHCDDKLDTGDVFDAIRQHPLVRFPHGEAGQQPPLADEALTVAACCAAAMPGAIEVIEIDGQGEFNLYDDVGFRIRLGKANSLEQKIGALPKALRLCQQDRGKLEYLDARNPDVFYEKWTEPIS